MSIRAEAEENLRVIRSLMEKATVYRAVSVTGAWVGGLCSVLVTIVALSNSEPPVTFPFVASWGFVLAITGVINFVRLWRDAARRREPFVSPGMRLALRAMLPALLGGGLCTFVSGVIGQRLLASLWVLFYGVSLLAASHFAPKSICWLGRAFFTSGALLLICGPPFLDSVGQVDENADAFWIMGSTFGLFHLIYAACVWPRKSAA